MIKAGTILEWESTIPYKAVRAGALAIARSDEDEDGMVDVMWLPHTKHLSLTQHDGGYYAEDFRIVTTAAVKSDNP